MQSSINHNDPALAFDSYILDHFISKAPEDIILKGLEFYIEKFGQQLFKKYAVPGVLRSTLNANDQTYPVLHCLLHGAVGSNFIKLAKRLIELGLPVDGYFRCSTSPIFDNLSTLMRANEYPDGEMFRLLLENEPDVLIKNGIGASILMYPLRREFVAKILNYAQRKNCFEKLLSIHMTDNSCVYDTYALNAALDRLHTLIQFDQYQSLVNKPKFLANLRHGAWAYPEKTKEIDSLCQEVRKLIIRTSAPQLDVNRSALHLSDAIQFLFGDLTSVPQDAKQMALKYALAQCYALLCPAAPCLKYLKFLNAEFKRYYEEKHQHPFQTLDRSTYEIRQLNDLEYPIPKSNYTGIKKSSALNEFLFHLFRKYGLAKQAFEALGYLPEHIAEDVLSLGDFFLEARIGDNLFHGKVSHMLQRAILLYAIEDQKISLTQIIDGQEIKLTMLDLMKAMMDIKEHTSKVESFIYLCDRRFLKEVSFTDPHRLSSVIMCHGAELGMPELSDSLTDSFCKGLQGSLDAYNRMYNPVSLNEYLVQINDLVLGAFIIHPKHIEENTKKAIEKHKILGNKGISFGLFIKHYQVNSQFKLKEFTATTEKEEKRSMPPYLG